VGTTGTFQQRQQAQPIAAPAASVPRSNSEPGRSSKRLQRFDRRAQHDGNAEPTSSGAHPATAGHSARGRRRQQRGN